MPILLLERDRITPAHAGNTVHVWIFIIVR